MKSNWALGCMTRDPVSDGLRGVLNPRKSQAARQLMAGQSCLLRPREYPSDDRDIFSRTGYECLRPHDAGKEADEYVIKTKDKRNYRAPSRL